MVLIISAVIVAQKRRLWNDEILSLVLLQDPSFSHMLKAWGDTFNVAPPLYFILGWMWDKLFGSSDVSLRLFGSLCICIALLLTWSVLCRVWRSASAAIGVVSVYCLSSLVIYHNTEARMYGLFVATCAFGLYIYQKLAANDRPSTPLLVANILSQAMIVLTHLYGLLYSFAFLFSLILGDWTARRIRKKVYASFLLGWTFLLPFLPGIINQADNKAEWFKQISVHKFISYYNVSYYNNWDIGSYSTAEVFSFYLLLILTLSAIMHIVRILYPRFAQPNDVKLDPQAEINLVVVGVVFLLAPTVAFAITIVITPVLMERYIMPSITIGWPIVMTFGLWRLLFSEEDAPSARRSLIVALLAGPALAYPLWHAFNFPFEKPPGQNDPAFGYVDLPIAMEAGHDYLPRMHYSGQPARYFHIRDWDTAVKNTASRIATGDYTHMKALNRHYSYVQDVESTQFLSKYDRFLVWNEPDLKWFEWRILSDSNYLVSRLGTDRGVGGTLELYLVEKRSKS